MDTEFRIGDYVVATDYAKQKVSWLLGNEQVYRVEELRPDCWDELPRMVIWDIAGSDNKIEVPAPYYRRATPAEVDTYLRMVKAEKEQQAMNDVVKQLAAKREAYDLSAYLNKIIDDARKQPLYGYRADTIITDEIEDEETLEDLLDELEDNKAERRELLLKVKRLVDAELA